MLNAPSLDELIIRTGRIVDPNMVFLLLEDPTLAEEDVPHAGVAFWIKARDWHRSRLDYNGISAAVVPGEAGVSRRLIVVGNTGNFTVMSGGTTTHGVIRNEDALASVNYVHGSVIAVGILGRIYRMIDSTSWEVLTDLSIDTNIESVCQHPTGGFLVCGWQGLIALYDRGAAERLESGTNVILTSVICDNDGEIIACGQRGTIVRGSKDSLKRLDLG